MSNPKRSDIATEADWSFYEDPDARLALVGAVNKACREFREVIDREDATQEAMLWLAVRPEQVARARQQEGGWASLSQNIYANALRPSLVRSKNQANRTVSRDAVELDEVSW
jgi:hypothetical protein